MGGGPTEGSGVAHPSQRWAGDCRPASCTLAIGVAALPGGEGSTGWGHWALEGNEMRTVHKSPPSDFFLGAPQTHRLQEYHPPSYLTRDSRTVAEDWSGGEVTCLSPQTHHRCPGGKNPKSLSPSFPPSLVLPPFSPDFFSFLSYLLFFLSYWDHAINTALQLSFLT